MSKPKLKKVYKNCNYLISKKVVNLYRWLFKLISIFYKDLYIEIKYVIFKFK